MSYEDNGPTYNHPFTDMGVDIELGASLYKHLNISQNHLKDAQTAGKLKEIADFFSRVRDPLFTLSAVARSNKNPNISQLDHMTAFVQLQNNKMDLLQL